MGREVGSRSTAANYHNAQEIEAAHFLLRLVDDPAGLMNHIKKLSRAHSRPHPIRKYTYSSEQKRGLPGIANSLWIYCRAVQR